MTVQARIKAVADAKAAVLAHCMCAAFEEAPGYFFVLYPPGFCVDGCRVSKGMGQANALAVLLEKMELHWKGGL